MFVGKNRVESGVVRMYWNDGVLDLLAGTGTVLIGAAWLLDLVALSGVAAAIVLPFWRPVRVWLTEPRLGYVELSEPQQRRNSWFVAGVIGLGIVLLAGGIWTVMASGRSLGLQQQSMVAAFPACIFGVLALLVMLITAQTRFLCYALAFWGAGVVVIVSQIHPGWALLAGGVFTVIGGGITLSRFLMRYRIPADAK